MASESSAARDTECRFTPGWQPGTDSNLQRAGKQPSSACACGWPEKECLHRALGNGPPFLPEPCEPKAEASSAAKVYVVTRWLYIEEGEGFDIEGVFASEEAAQAFIDREPIPGKRYRILEQEVRDV